MEEYQAKGYILEEVVKKILRKQGYEEIPSDIQKYYNVEKIGGDLKIRGRGAKHQIDALGQFGYPIPFVYPLRLLTEAKCWDKKVGIDVIRNFVGVLKDVSENYFIEKFDDLKEKQRGRFTDVAAVFSTSSFSSDAQMYAYAQGIFLVSCFQILNLVEDFYNFLKIKNEPITKKLIREDIPEYFGSNTPIEKIYFANVMGSYPILIKSSLKFPKSFFKERDQYSIRLMFEKRQGEFEDSPKFIFEIILGAWKGEFEIPEYILQKLSDRFDHEELLNFKSTYINSIEIPLVIDNVKRIISLKLDSEWINLLKEQLKP